MRYIGSCQNNYGGFMKRIIIFFLFLSTIAFVYSQEYSWKTNKNGYYYIYDKSTIYYYSQSNQPYEKDMNVNIFGYKFLNDGTNKVIGLVDEKQNFYIDFDDLSFTESSTYLPEELLKGEWIHSYYFDALKAKNPEIILQNEPWWDKRKGWKPDPYGEYPLSWGEEFEFNYGSYYFTKFTFSNGHVYYYIDKIQKKDEYYYITSKRRDSKEYDEKLRKEYSKSSDYEKIQNYSEIDLIIKLDGDYMDVYLNSTNNYLGTYCYANSETVRELLFFVRDIEALPVDFNNVRYPRHADGSCDYDEIKQPVDQLSDNDSVYEEEEFANPAVPLSEDEEDVKTVEETVPSVKKSSSFPFVIIVVSATTLLLCIVIIIIARKKKSQ